jgi:hypothetical protein
MFWLLVFGQMTLPWNFIVTLIAIITYPFVVGLNVTGKITKSWAFQVTLIAAIFYSFMSGPFVSSHIVWSGSCEVTLIAAIFHSFMFWLFVSGRGVLQSSFIVTLITEISYSFVFDLFVPGHMIPPVGFIVTLITVIYHSRMFRMYVMFKSWVATKQCFTFTALKLVKPLLAISAKVVHPFCTNILSSFHIVFKSWFSSCYSFPYHRIVYCTHHSINLKIQSQLFHNKSFINPILPNHCPNVVCTIVDNNCINNVLLW